MCLQDVGRLAFVGTKLWVQREGGKLGREDWSSQILEGLKSKQGCSKPTRLAVSRCHEFFRKGFT